MSETDQTVPIGQLSVNNPCAVPGKATGKRPARGDPRTLNFARFVMLAKAPAKYDPWKRRAPFPGRTFGNTQYGDCTIASQCNHASRLERVETKRTPQIADEEAVRVYLAMTERLYGGGDTGAYEIDALNNWRRPDLTFRDDAGHPLTIDAFTKVNQADAEEVKAAIALSGKFGIKLCLNLPLAFSRIDPPNPWDVPAGEPLTGDWEPGAWGGHSLYADAYDKAGVRLVHSWYTGEGVEYHQTLTWAALAAYCDECYVCFDSIDLWRSKPLPKTMTVDWDGIRKSVNKASSLRIK
jgi:hypothetical protein